MVDGAGHPEHEPIPGAGQHRFLEHDPRGAALTRLEGATSDHHAGPHISRADVQPHPLSRAEGPVRVAEQ
jgi:hypothetical protein